MRWSLCLLSAAKLRWKLQRVLMYVHTVVSLCFEKYTDQAFDECVFDMIITHTMKSLMLGLRHIYDLVDLIYVF